MLQCFMAGLVLASIFNGLAELVKELRETWFFRRRIVALEKRAAALQEALSHQREEK